MTVRINGQQGRRSGQHQPDEGQEGCRRCLHGTGQRPAARGVITEQRPLVSAYRSVTFWANNQVYLQNGPSGRKLVPFVDVPYVATSQGGGVGGTVPATLALTLGPAASFGPFTPGVGRTYETSTTATVTSTAGDATLSVNGGRLSNGPFTLAEPVQVAFSKARGPRQYPNDPVNTRRVPVGGRPSDRLGRYSVTATASISMR